MERGKEGGNIFPGSQWEITSFSRSVVLVCGLDRAVTMVQLGSSFWNVLTDPLDGSVSGAQGSCLCLHLPGTEQDGISWRKCFVRVCGMKEWRTCPSQDMLADQVSLHHECSGNSVLSTGSFSQETLNAALF